MATVLVSNNDKSVKIGVYDFVFRKKPALCVQKGNEIFVCATFSSEEQANFFMSELSKMVGAKEVAENEID